MSTPRKSSRLAYLDWLRGVTVLVMIEAHTFDAWTLASERARPMFGRLMVLGGMAAPLCLFLAGGAAALAASAEIDRGRSAGEAARRVERRGWQIFLLAFLFRLQSFVLGGFSRPATLLKVDILNVMGPAIACTAALWGTGSTRRARAILLTTATLLLLGVSPWIRTTPLLSALPDPLEWYIRPPVGQGTFTIFPWAGFVLAGGVLGVALDGARSAGWSTWRLQASIAATGLALVVVGDWAGRQPILFPGATFWGTSPAYFAIRAGLILLLVFAALNRRLPGAVLVFAGLALNLAVIAPNGGMPVDPAAARAAGAGTVTIEGTAKHHALSSDDVLPFLADVIAVPQPAGVVASFGDVVLYCGVIAFLITTMLGRARENVRPPARWFQMYRGKHLSPARRGLPRRLRVPAAGRTPAAARWGTAR